MSQFSLKHLAQIIERDSKDSTYKFALLRGTIDIIQNYPHYKQIESGGRISFPMGLMVLKWIEYYYPLLSSNIYIPQRYGDYEGRSIAFRKEFKDVINLYKSNSGSEELLYDLKRGIDNRNRSGIVLKLVRKLRDTIVKQPMFYIGSSVGMGGEIYKYKGVRSNSPYEISQEWIIDSMGFFSIPIEFHHVLQVVGAFVSGTNSIIFKWAEFTSNLTKDVKVNTSSIISLLNHEVNERDVKQAKNFYANILKKEGLECVWSGKTLHESLNIDHALPFVALRNNDLWNLLPTNDQINNRKRDAIPTPELLKSKSIKERIIWNWEKMYEDFHDQFISEIKIALLGSRSINEKNWENTCYEGFVNMSHYLIEERGLTPWNFNSSQ